MKLINFATIVAVAGIGKFNESYFRLLFLLMLVIIAQVFAAPLVVVTTSNIIPSTNPHAIPHGVDGRTEFVGKMRKGPCGRNRLRQKAVEISNLFREALGLPLIKSNSHHRGSDDGRLGSYLSLALPTFLHLSTSKMRMVTLKSLISEHECHHGYHHAHGRHHRHKGHHHLGKGSFINRIHYSIMNLGRWEGRAVAFRLRPR